MGIRERIITEVICDYCGEEITGEPGKTGLLEAKTAGVRGRAERWAIAFHEACYAKIVRSATKPAATRRRVARAKATPEETKAPARKPATAKKATATKKATGRKRARRSRPAEQETQTAAS